MKDVFTGLVELNGVDYRFIQLAKMAGKKEVEVGRVLYRLDTLGVILESMNKSIVTETEKDRKKADSSRVMTSQMKEKSKSRELS